MTAHRLVVRWLAPLCYVTWYVQGQDSMRLRCFTSGCDYDWLALKSLPHPLSTLRLEGAGWQTRYQL